MKKSTQPPIHPLGAPERSSFGSRDAQLRTSGRLVRAEVLYVVRESDEYDFALFDAMRYQTYAPHADVPAIAAVMAAGLAPWDRSGSFTVSLPQSEGAAWEITVLVEEIIQGGTRAVLFRVDGTWHLWSMSSAARADSGGVNDFTMILVRVVERLYPKSVHAANFSRLIRSHDQGSLLLHKFAGRVDTVYAGVVEFPLTGPNAALGKMMFSMFSTIASMERDWIVTRLLAGKVAKWRRGEWPYGAQTVPFGYRYDPETRTLVVDRDKSGKVREMLLVLGSDMAPSAARDRLAAVGMESMRPSRGARRRTSVATLTNARAFIDSLYAWASIWVSGEYLFRVSNPFQSGLTIAGVETTRHEGVDDDPGEFQMLTRVPLPAGGWAEQSVLDAVAAAAMRRTKEKISTGSSESRPLAAMARSASRSPELIEAVLNPLAMRGNDAEAAERRTRRRGNRTMSMLSGMTWRDETFTYELQVQRRGMYALMRKLRSSASAGTGEAMGGELS